MRTQSNNLVKKGDPGVYKITAILVEGNVAITTIIAEIDDDDEDH